MREGLLRARAQQCLPPDALLRVDRGDALYVTDCAPAKAALDAAGFETRMRGALVTIHPSRALVAPLKSALAGTGAHDVLYGQLARLSAHGVCTGELALMTESLKLLEQGGDPVHMDRKLRQTAAVCLRSGCGGALGLCRSIQILAEEGTT